MEQDLGDNTSSKFAWQTAKNPLGMNTNIAPTALKDEQDGMITNPARIASKLNSYFIEKVRILRAKTDIPPTIDPIVRLEQWISRRQNPPPAFKIQEIDRRNLEN